MIQIAVNIITIGSANTTVNFLNVKNCKIKMSEAKPTGKTKDNSKIFFVRYLTPIPIETEIKSRNIGNKIQARKISCTCTI